jgi:hypothetical protein
MATTITQLIVKEGAFPLFHLCSSTHMLKSQPQKTTLRRRGSAVGILLSGLEGIAAALHSFGTLPHEPLKPWLLRMPDVLPTLPLHCVSDSVAPPASQVQKEKGKDHEYRLPVPKRLRLSSSLSSSVETAPSTSLSPVSLTSVEHCTPIKSRI